MSSDTNWKQIAVIGTCVAAAGVGLYYLWASDDSSSANRNAAPNGGDDGVNDASGATDSRQSASNTATRQRPPSGLAGPKLPPQPKKGSRNSPPSGQLSSSNGAEEQKRKSAEAKDKSDIRSFADAVKQEPVAEKADDATSASQETSMQENSKEGKAEEAPEIAWSQTQEEVTIWISIVAGVRKQHIGFKLTSTEIEVEVQGSCVLAGTLPFPVQPDDSNWQFDTRRQQRVLAITLQKGISAYGFPAWNELIKDAPGTSVSNRAPDAAKDPDHGILLSL